MYLSKYKEKIKKAQKYLSSLNTKEKNSALKYVAISLDEQKNNIINANKLDMEKGRAEKMSKGLLDRLYLDNDRIDDMIKSIYTIISLPDPVGKSSFVSTLENGLRLTKISVPLGIISVIYEARPNVTVDSFALSFKSSNAVILRGSSNSMNSNIALEKAITEGLAKAQIPIDVIHLVKDENRKIVDEIITFNGFIDLAIPRGGKSLIERVIKNSTIPTIQTGEGNNHIYIDENADIDMSLKIIKNAKLQRVGVCNAVEKLLVHENIAPIILPLLFEQTCEKLEFRCDEKAQKFIENSKPITDEELYTEYLDYIIGVIIVTDIDKAIEHITTYGTKHSETIITQNYQNALKFQKNVDAAAVYVNASPRFTDGGMFGFGSEIGISTQKIHVRGPVGLDNLVSDKYLVLGEGQIRL